MTLRDTLFIELTKPGLGPKPKVSALRDIKDVADGDFFGVGVEYQGVQYMLVHDLGNGFGIVTPVGASFPAPLVLIPLRFVIR